MEAGRNFLVFIHVLSAFLMAGPFYMLMLVNERARLGPKIIYPADRYMESIVFKTPRRCIWWLLTILFSGLFIVWVDKMSISVFFTNWILDVKLFVFLVILILTFFVVLRIEPQIEALMDQLSPDKTAPEEMFSKLGMLRKKRKKITAACLFLVLTEIIMGLQVYSHWSPYLTLILLLLAGIFVWRAFYSFMVYGWA